VICANTREWDTHCTRGLYRNGVGAEIQLFKSDPGCRIFLSTDSGSTGLNLQNASVVINCDLPWNPARLEQRIARAWRKHQARAVTVIHLVSEHTIEHKMLGTLSSKQALADGVLDLRGDLQHIQFRAGRQAFLARLQQIMAPPVAAEPVPKKKPVPVDRSLAFSQLAHEKLGAALVRCEERYPGRGAHSVLVVVVERDAALWRTNLAPLHEELFGRNGSDPLSPTMLEVIDRSTDEAIERLIAAGLVARATRAARPLFPNGGESVVALSEEEKQKALAHRQQAARKLKMARLLGDGGLQDEEREALLQAAHFAARALAVEHKASEPASLDEALQSPASFLWGEALPALRNFASNASVQSGQVIGELQRILRTL